MWDYKHLAGKVSVHNNARLLQSSLQMIVLDLEVGPELIELSEVFMGEILSSKFYVLNQTRFN